MASGKAFADQSNPRVAVRVGERGSYGFAEITDLLFSTRGPGGCLASDRYRRPLILEI